MARPPYSTLPAALKRFVHLVGLAVLVTGIAWVALHYAPSGWMDESRSRYFQVLFLKLHGAAAMLALIALGTLLVAHILPALRNPQNRAAGVALLACAGILALSGWGLYYLGDDDLRTWASDIHIAIGTAITLTFLWHIGHRKRGED